MFVNSTAIMKPDLTTDNMSYDANEDMSMRFWKSVDAKLKECHMSRTELAKKAKLSPQSLTSAKYLRSNLTIYTVLRITKALGCMIEDLIYDQSDLIAHRGFESTSLAGEVTEDETCSISSLSKHFDELKDDEKLAVLVHVYSILGISVRETMEKIDAVSIKGEEK